MKLICKNIIKTYGNKQALSNIDLELEPGKLIGLVGSNGAGKTTLLKILATLEKPTHGNVYLDGVDLRQKPNAMREILGYLPQNVPVYPNLTAQEYLLYMAAIKGIRRFDAINQIQNLLVQFNLTDTGNKPLSAFSGGMKQRVGICCTLLGNPRIIIVDEPTVGLDPHERVAFRNLLENMASERIVILSTHIVSDVEIAAGRILLLDKGVIQYDGTPQGLVKKFDNQVWEFTLESKEELDYKCHIVNMIQTSSGLRMRGISKVRPHLNATKVSATLEDACLSVMKGRSEG